MNTSCKLLIPVALIAASQQFVNYFISDENLWYVSQFLSMLETATSLTFLTAVIPYRQLFFKTVSSVWCTTSITDCLIYPLWFISSPIADYAHTFQFLSSVIVFFYICSKSYSRIKSDRIERRYIYQVRAIPHNFQDLVLSVLTLQPFGGTGVICGGFWYHYRHGKLQRDLTSRIPLSKVVIIKTRRQLHSDAPLLDSHISERWTWRHNCLTRLYLVSRKT